MASKKCAHPICTCEVTDGKYCSVECEAMEKMADVNCTCPHKVCKGHTE
jgi:hypothetical protein